MQFNNEIRGNRNILFKGNNALLDFSRDRVNNSRVRQKENRAKNFIENRFQDGKSLILQPTPKKTPKRHLTVPVATNFYDEKENSEANNHSVIVSNKTSKTLKMERQQLFMARYKAWKKEKDVRKVVEQIKLKPFIAAAWPTTQSGSIGSVSMPIRKDFKFEIKKNVMNVPKTLKSTKKNTNFVVKSQETKSQNAAVREKQSDKINLKQFKKPAAPFAIRSIPSVHLKALPTPANPTKIRKLLAGNSKQAAIAKPMIHQLKHPSEKLSPENKNDKLKFLKPTEKPVNREKFITPIDPTIGTKSLVSTSFVTSTHRKNSAPDEIVPKEFSLISPIDNEGLPDKTIIAPEIENECNSDDLKPISYCGENCKPLQIVEKKIDFTLRKRKSRRQQQHENDCIGCDLNYKSPKSPRLINKTPSSSATKRQIPLNRKSEEYFIDVNKTPMLTREKDNPMNYMSPNVMVSRGKFNKKDEFQKRNSVYLCDATTPDPISPEDLNKKRTKESIVYFRVQVRDETSKLIALCNDWQKCLNSLAPDLLENAGSMINATIGVTYQLLSKKIKKFEILIERCEETITTKKFDNVNIADLNDSEKPVRQEDLEGFWALIQQQIDDLQKRFDHLIRWKLNNWNDPDEITIPLKVSRKERTKNNVIKNKKSCASSKLKDAMKKMYAERKKRQNADLGEISEIFTPSKCLKRKKEELLTKTPVRRSGRISQILEAVRRNSTPRSLKRLSKSKNKKSNESETSPMITFTQNITPILRNPKWRNELQKSKSKTPQALPRKSILKTPGTARKNRNVLFNDRLEEFKSPDVVDTPEARYSKSGRKIIERLPIEDDSTQTTKRSLHLRNQRIVIMDPNVEIEIPRKRETKKNNATNKDVI